MAFLWPEGSLEDLRADTINLLTENGYGFLAAAFAGYRIDAIPRSHVSSTALASVDRESRVVMISEHAVDLGYYFALGAMCHECTHLGDLPESFGRSAIVMGLRKIAKVIADGERLADRVAIECLSARRLLLLNRQRSTHQIDAAIAGHREHSDDQRDDLLQLLIRKQIGIHGTSEITRQVEGQCRALVGVRKIEDARRLWQAFQLAMARPGFTAQEFVLIEIDLSK